MAIPVVGALIGMAEEGVGMVRDHFADKRLRKQKQSESDQRINEAVTEAKIKRLSTQQDGDIAWENTSLDKAGWKDEFWTIVLSIPLIMCFVPGGATYVKTGFDALKASTPEWYQYLILVAVASAFGVRKVMDFMKVKKGA